MSSGTFTDDFSVSVQGTDGQIPGTVPFCYYNQSVLVENLLDTSVSPSHAPEWSRTLRAT